MADDIRDAQEVCPDLGLEPLPKKMPAGLLQLVGETGWQLSHGEGSRLYVAWALLQRPAAVIFDESFAALDPETLNQCLTCVLRRAGTLLVIAHPQPSNGGLAQTAASFSPCLRHPKKV